MARTLDAITTDIKTAVRTYTSLNNFKFPEDGGSKVSVFNVIIFIVAASIYTFEVILDSLKADIQAIADSAPSGNASWLRNQILKFQYGDTVTLVNFVPTYSTVNTANKIITQCSVKDNGSGIVAIKVAKGSSPPFSPLSASEIIALKDYYYGTSETQGIGFAGVRATFITLDPDRLYVNANIYYLGQYVASTVKTNVIAAINSFLSSFQNENFDGRILMIKLVDAIQQVPGVTRVVINSVQARTAAQAFGSGVTVDIQGVYDTVAGHIISEDTSGQTLNDSITMNVES